MHKKYGDCYHFNQQRDGAELSLALSLQTNKGVKNMSIYIDSYNIRVEGEEENSKNKKASLEEKMSMSSKDGMNSKAFIDMVEQISDSHDARCDIHFKVMLKQHRYE